MARNVSLRDEYLNFIAEGNISALDFNMTNGNGNSSQFETGTAQAATLLYICLTPLLVTFGVGCNMLCVYVLYKTRLWLQSCSMYFISLDISDSIFLLQVMATWTGALLFSTTFYRPETCKFFTYLAYVTSTYNSMAVMEFTVERYFAVHYPLLRASVCTTRRTLKIIAATAVGSLLLNAPVLYFVGPADQQCGIESDKLELAAIFNWVDTIVSFTVPLLVILLLNICISITVYKERKKRAALRGRGEIAADEDMTQPSQHNVTVMLLLVSSVFFLCNLPAYAMRVYAYTVDMDSSEMSDAWAMMHSIAMILFYSNFGINLFLYCLSGKNFRDGLVQSVPLFGWFARKLNKNKRTGSPYTSHGSIANDVPSDVESSRRNLQQPQGYKYRVTFDNSRQRRSAATEDPPSESVEMHEMPLRFRPSLVKLDESDAVATTSMSRRPILKDTAISEQADRGHHSRCPKLLHFAPTVIESRSSTPEELDSEIFNTPPTRRRVGPPRRLLLPHFAQLNERSRNADFSHPGTYSQHSTLQVYPTGPTRRRILSRVVTPEESRFEHLRQNPPQYSSGAERRRAMSHLYN